MLNKRRKEEWKSSSQIYWGAFSKIKAEMDEKGGEFDFRYSLADYFLKEVWGWTRDKGKGHFKIERERKDILFYDDSDPPLPVLIVETVNPNEESTSHIGKLEGYLKEIGRVRYGILTNGHDFSVYEYEREKKGERINRRLELNIDEIVHKGFANLTEKENRDIFQLRIFVKDRFIKFGDVEYFKTYRNDIPLNYKLGYDLFIEGLKKSLKELNDVFTQFFNAYETRAHISGKRLREAFENWKKTRGGEAEPKETFCKETAYILLNRILFTRTCEDKGILPRRISREALAVFYEDHIRLLTPYLEALEDAFKISKRKYERIYQVKLFDWWRIEEPERDALEGEDKKEQRELEKELNYTIREGLKRLNHFDFKTVDSDILGHVYEDYLPKEERKKLGEYYTPPEVVRYILDAVGYISTEDIEEKKILDPACGSGTFLVEATKRLISKFLSKFHRRDVFRLEPEEAHAILNEIRGSVYGLDINVFSCYIAEMNLFFQTIDLYENVNRKYPEETFEGFNIFCADSLLPPEGKVDDFIDVRVKPFLNEQKDIARIKGMKFDFVVGNPPYIEFKRAAAEKKKEYIKIYETASGKFDFYILFIERGINWLQDYAKMSYICSNMFMKRDYGKKLRKFITDKCTVEQIMNFGESGIFTDVVNYPCIFVFKKCANKDVPVKCVIVSRGIEQKEYLKHINRHIYKNRYSDDAIEVFELKQDDLHVGGWNLIIPTERTIFDKIKNASNVELKDICHQIFEGIATGKDEVFFVNDSKVEEHGLEHDLLKPQLKGAEVKRWSISWDNLWVIYPYTCNSVERVVPIPEKELKEKYPNIWDYLTKNKKLLEERKYLMKSKKEWYELWCQRNPDWFEKNKILTPEISDKNNFAFDEEGFYANTKLYGIVLKTEYNEFYPFILGLLNSRLIEFYYKHITVSKAGGFYAYKTQFLSQLPIKLPKTTEEEIAKEIINKVERILNNHKELSELENKISKFPDSYISEELHPLLEVMESQDLPRESYSPSRLRIEVFKDVEGRMVYKVALTKRDYIAFKAESSAKFLFEALKRKDRIIKNDLLRIQVPSDADAERIMSEYERNLEKIGSLKREIADLDKSIDELVYELYGMDEEDRKVIEEF